MGVTTACCRKTFICKLVLDEVIRPLQVVIRFLVRASSKSRGGQAGLVIMSLFYLVNMTTKILVTEQSYTHLVTKES